MKFDNTHVTIDLDIIAANFRAIREKAGVPVMAIVKADAYGHGAIQVAPREKGMRVLRCQFHAGSHGAAKGRS